MSARKNERKKILLEFIQVTSLVRMIDDFTERSLKKFDIVCETGRYMHGQRCCWRYNLWPMLVIHIGPKTIKVVNLVHDPPSRLAPRRYKVRHDMGGPFFTDYEGKRDKKQLLRIWRALETPTTMTVQFFKNMYPDWRFKPPSGWPGKHPAIQICETLRTWNIFVY